MLLLAFHFCLALPAAFTQPGAHLLAEPCKSIPEAIKQWAPPPSSAGKTISSSERGEGKCHGRNPLFGQSLLHIAHMATGKVAWNQRRNHTTSSDNIKDYARGRTREHKTSPKAYRDIRYIFFHPQASGVNEPSSRDRHLEGGIARAHFHSFSSCVIIIVLSFSLHSSLEA